MKKNGREIRWLFEQVPGLVSDGVLSEETARKLSARYGGKAAADAGTAA